MEVRFHAHADPDALTRAVASVLAKRCDAGVAERGHAWLALAGGRTPLPIYARLAASKRPGRLDVVPTDDRCVAHDHPASNVRELRAAFTATRDAQVHALTCADGDIQASLMQARALLSAHPAPFDAVLLGMGADGHIASLFPGDANLAAGLALDSGQEVIATLPDPLPPQAPFARISLTLPRLLRAHSVLLAITGQDKRAVLERARHARNSSLPIAALLRAGVPIDVHWSP